MYSRTACYELNKQTSERWMPQMDQCLPEERQPAQMLSRIEEEDADFENEKCVTKRLAGSVVVDEVSAFEVSCAMHEESGRILVQPGDETFG